MQQAVRHEATTTMKRFVFGAVNGSLTSVALKKKTRVYFDLDVNGSAVATVKVSAWIDVRKDGADRLLNRLIFII